MERIDGKTAFISRALHYRDGPAEVRASVRFRGLATVLLTTSRMGYQRPTENRSQNVYYLRSQLSPLGEWTSG
jgi:hypothetical protein